MKINIAFVSNFYNHGKVYDQWGTSFSILLSRLECVNNIDVICPIGIDDNTIFPEKIKLVEAYNLNKKLSILNILKILRKNNYDLIIFNYGPTVFGSSNLMNLIGLFTPVKISKIKKTVIISQGSSLTNDAKNLGYSSLFDKIRTIFVNILERHLYRKVKSFAQLPLYERMLKEKVKNNKVTGVLKSDYIDAISTVYLNGYLDKEYIYVKQINARPSILLHGFWGPQKDIEFALKILRNLKNKKYDFNLIISGGVNVHFEGYQKYFNSILKKYNDIICKYLGYVNEKDLFKLFTDSDLILMPYKVPGGQSGVLEMSSFFASNVICIDFPEFREEIKADDNIILVKRSDFESKIIEYISNYKLNDKRIFINKKIEKAEKNIMEFLKESLKN